VTTVHVVIDTGYLLELYRIPDKHDRERHDLVKQSSAKAVADGHRLNVPLPVVMEVARSISHLKKGDQRRGIAQAFSEAVCSSLETMVPWVITPHPDLQSLAKLMRHWADGCATLGLSLTDTSVAAEAERIKSHLRATTGGRVHIWTFDRALKAREPDSQPAQL
jgi:hypothetical protein